MKQVIAVCGPSAVGKATLIKRILDGDQMLRDRFGIGDQTVVASGARFGPLRQQDAMQDVLLWKRQCDNDGWFCDLLQRYPEAEHRAIVIWLPPAVHFERMVEKWPRRARKSSPETLRKAFPTKFTPHFRDELPQLGITVELVDGSTSSFALLEGWPQDEADLGRPTNAS
jgi:hypothetical protein